MGRCKAQTGIESFGRLVEQLMRTEPNRSANSANQLCGRLHRHPALSGSLRDLFQQPGRLGRNELWRWLGP
jgi:hypothetical protein